MIMAVPCDKLFEVSEDKVEDFNSVKPNEKIRQKAKEIVKEISKSITIEERLL